MDRFGIADKPLLSFEVLGEPASKANSRRLVKIAGRPVSIKSQKALDYVKAFQMQCPKLIKPVEDYIHLDLTIWYSSWRPDLDESVILDAMQGYVYVNDRQVVSKYVQRRIDRERPRTRIDVSIVESFPGEDVPRRPRRS